MKKKQLTCECDGWWFPHRYGCRGCNFREDFIIERSLDDNNNLPGNYFDWLEE